MPDLILFDNVTVTVQGKTLLANIRFAVGAGEKAVIYGKSGSGKSSLLKTLLGMHSIDSGTVYFRQQALSACTVAAIRSKCAYIGQEPLLGADNVREALLLPFRFKAHRDREPSEEQLAAVLKRLQLSADILPRDSQRISGGEKQRIALARGLLLGKTVYLLDEVTSALDAESKQAVFEVFTDPNLTVLAVTHDPDWQHVSDRVFDMHAGQLTQTS
jgi:ABC-type uncharacterized transport system, ATPase component